MTVALIPTKREYPRDLDVPFERIGDRASGSGRTQAVVYLPAGRPRDADPWGERRSPRKAVLRSVLAIDATDVPAVRHVVHELRELCRRNPSGRFPNASVVHALTLLRRIATFDSVFPTVSMDADGATMLSWAAEPMALTIALRPNGDGYLRFRRRRKETPVVVHAIEDVKVVGRATLLEISEHVNKNNPEWRGFFEVVE